MIRNANRVDHVAALVRREKLEATVARLSEGLNISFYPPFDRTEAGLRVAASIDGGLELIAPLSDDPENPLVKRLESHGEHWMSVVFGVDDMDAVCDRFAAMGYKPQLRRSGLTGVETFARRIARLEKAVFEPGMTGGLPMGFCLIDDVDAAP